MDEKNIEENKINECIKNNDFSELKKIIKENKKETIELTNDKTKCDILINSIENNASSKIIKFIIDEWYEKINRYLYVKYLYTEDNAIEKNSTKNYVSPLYVAIKNNNFEIADYLLKHGADINDIKKNTLLTIINKNNSKYILNKNILINEDIIIDMIKSAKLFFVKDYFNCYIYNDAVISNLLIYYKNSNSVSTKILENIINNEENKIRVTENMYKECLNIYFCNDEYLKNNDYEKDYELLIILFDNDKRPMDEKLLELYKILKNYSRSPKIELINKIKRKEINIKETSPILPVLEKSVATQEKEEAITYLVQKNDLSDLKKYIEKNDIKLTNITGEYNNSGIYYYEILNRALYNENESIIKYLIDCGADISMTDIPDKSPLHDQLYISKILKEGDTKLVEKLIKWGANVNKVVNDVPPLKEAISLNNMELVKLMINHDANVNYPDILNYAFSKNNIDIVKYLIKCGADVSKSDALSHVMRNPNLDSSSKEELVKYLIENNANVNDRLSLILAASNNEETIVKYLVEKGADVNKVSIKGDGNTPLGAAISSGNLNIVKYLISKGSIISNNNAIYQSELPISIAINNNDKEMVKYLIECGFDPNSKKNPYKYWEPGPLGNAALKNNLEMIKILIEHGVKITGDALISAVQEGNINIVEYFINHEADVNEKTHYYGDEWVTPLNIVSKHSLSNYLLLNIYIIK
ncbi:hypothetical protein PIROE2DRAFT_12357 [Piromyces sp. E2]|nr:hypothetical protein PIROE2DRAFT_12357 [Piromyces sp. E2]|eukprot:OUM61618.1 hypothetical protein PIROE2DRAFT_12357 [Piromyces sp. E2]